MEELENIKGFSKLPNNGKELFKRIYKNHLRAMGEKEREKHLPNNMKQIKVIVKERYFEVQYRHEFYKYYFDGTWG